MIFRSILVLFTFFIFGCGMSNPFDDNIPYKTRFDDGLSFFEEEKYVKSLPKSDRDEIIDLEKPELDEIIAKPNNDTEDEWNSLIEKATIEAQKEQLNKKVKEWNEKLEKFNTVVDEPETKPVEFIQEDQKNF